MVNKVRIEIAGSRYVIATPEGEERVLSLGREIDAQVRQLMDGNDRVSLNDALVLCCLNYANAYKKERGGRGQYAHPAHRLPGRCHPGPH